MKTIGLLGGMSYESTTVYYQKINQLINQKMGGSKSADIVMVSFDFDRIEQLQNAQKWDELTAILSKAAKDLKSIGADFVAICTNTMHLMADDVQKNSKLPLIHIASAVSQEVNKQGMKKVALLGTKFTMTKDFYKDVLNKNGIKVIIPKDDDLNTVHDIIYNELIKGQFLNSSQQKYLDIIERLKEDGAEGVVLGCTEIPILLKDSVSPIPVFDSMDIHIKAIVAYALS